LVRGGGAGAVVKADAYELGAQYVAPALHAEGCSDFFVAHLDEGLRLRPQTPVSSIYILNGLPRGDEADCTDAGLARRPRVSRFSSL
jgi:alanine racemase